jgi:hypothetical protein
VRHLDRLLRTFGAWLPVLLCGSAAQATEVWLQPWVDCPPCHSAGEDDTQDLFEPGAPWAVAMSHTNVIAFTPWWLTLMTDADITQAVAWMDAHGVAMALEIEGLPADPACSGGIEGFQVLSGAQAQAARLVRLGAHPKYAAMDEPLWGGHYWNAGGACQYDIDTLARNVATMTAVYVAAFPDIVTGDIEPIGAIMQSRTWTADIRQFLASFQKYTGSPLGFMQFDEAYDNNWKIEMAEMTAELRSDGVPVGYIYRSQASSYSSANAVAATIQQFVSVEDGLGLKPDQAVFGDWDEFPQTLLPETSNQAQTYAIVQYAKPSYAITQAARAAQVAGGVSDAQGRAAANREVALQCWTPVDAAQAFAAGSSGMVPATAKYGLMGVRVNLEDDIQSGANDLTLAAAFFTQKQSSTSFRFTAGLPGWQVATTGAATATVGTGRFGEELHATVGAGDTLFMNSAIFDVTPGAPYSFRVTGGLADGSTGSAYAGVFFMDASFQGSRVESYFGGSFETLAATSTQADGSFSFAGRPGGGCEAPRLVVQPDAQHRQTDLALTGPAAEPAAAVALSRR